MDYLIDGNNLLYALADAGVDVGRSGLCRLLAPLTRQGAKVHVVFDGSRPPEGLARQIEMTGVGVSYAAGRPADDVLLERLAAHTAPRRLTVVSSDRQIRRPARARRCQAPRSQEFARRLLRDLHRGPAARPVEPPEKHTGLTPEQAEEWLKEFQADDAAGELAETARRDLPDSPDPTPGP